MEIFEMEIKDKLYIGSNIEVMITDIYVNRSGCLETKLAFKAPRSVEIDRTEVRKIKDARRGKIKVE